MKLDHIDQIAAGALEGFLVRKDLVRRFSKQFPVPTYVVEFLLGRYCATTDEKEIAETYPLSLNDWTPAEGADTSSRAAKTEEGLILHTCHILTPFETILNLRFTPHGVEIRCRRNVGFGGNEYCLIGYKE